MEKYRQMATDILSNVGGQENVTTVTHCMTRLRFNLKDESIVDDSTIQAIDGVLSVVRSGGQVQVVIGPTVDKVYSEICGLGNFEVADLIIDDLEEPVKEKFSLKKIGNNIMSTLSGCITPILPVFIVCGIMKMFVVLFGPDNLNIMPETSDIYRLLNLVGNAGYYYFPIFTAYSAAKKFGCNPVISLLLAGVMVHPDMLGIVEAGESFTVYGIPMQLINYTQMVIPIILDIWVLSYVEKYVKKIVPDMLRTLGIPVLCVAIMLPIALCAVGPFCTLITNGIAQVIIWLSNTVGFLTIGIVGGLWSLIIATGMHVPILTTSLPISMSLGYDPIFLPGTLAQAFAQMAISLGYSIRAKGKDNKALGFNCFITYTFGKVSEPMIYGILLRDKKALAWNIIGGFAGGITMGLLGAKVYIFSGVGFPFLNPLRFGQDIVAGTIGCVVAFVVTFVLSMILGFEGEKKLSINKFTKKAKG